MGIGYAKYPIPSKKTFFDILVYTKIIYDFRLNAVYLPNRKSKIVNLKFICIFAVKFKKLFELIF